MKKICILFLLLIFVPIFISAQEKQEKYVAHSGDVVYVSFPNSKVATVKIKEFFIILLYIKQMILIIIMNLLKKLINKVN